MHVKLGSKVEAGQVLATLFAQEESRFAEPEQLLTEALTIGDAPAAPPPLVREIISAENKDSYLKAGHRP
jgi:pyrimidine-nucleoside phosphorylase